MIKKLTFLFCIIFSVNCLAAENTPEVNAISAALIDADTGRVLWGKNEDKPMAMASTTKIMTAIIALENGNLKDIVTVGKNPPLAPPVKMHLQKGEEMTLEQLMYALLMQSSNDAAVAIAEHIGGSVEGFCAMMNGKAKELGCKDTVFETPNGLDKGNHHSTAEDMALIGAYAIKNEDFVRISNTRSISFKSNKKSYSITNKNRLLDSYEGAVGIKTGFTGKAGHCFVGAARRGDVTLVSVVLASGWGSAGKSRKWSDTREILNFGFENYKKYSIMGDDIVINVDKAETDTTGLKYKNSIEILMDEEEKNSITCKNELPDRITAPVYEGDVIGKGSIFIGDNKVGEVDIVACEDVERLGIIKSFGKVMEGWIMSVCS